MRVIALYDIHGNIDALKAVLAEPLVRDADAVLVGGDVVPGAFASDCLALLQAVERPVHWIRGNGEREVAEAAAGQVDPETVSPEALAELTAALNAATLGASVSSELGALPQTIELDGVLYCHASPRRDDEMLTRLTPSARWTAALADASAPLVVGGHTHQQDDRRVDAVRFVNAGSVGLPYEGDPAARWALISDGTPALKATPYEAAAAGRRMLEAGWPDRRSVEGALIQPVDPAVVTKLFEGIE